MDALDYVPKEEKEVIVKFLRMPILGFNHHNIDSLAYKNDIDDMDAFSEMLREVHDVSAKEVGLESYKEFSDKLYKAAKKCKPKRRRRAKVKKEDEYVFEPSNDNEGLPF